MLNTDRILHDIRLCPEGLLQGRRPARSGRPNWSKLLVFSAGDGGATLERPGIPCAALLLSWSVSGETSLKKRLSPLESSAWPLQLGEIGLPAFADPGPERQPDAVAHLRMFGRRSGLRNATGRSTYWTPLQTGESTRYRARTRSTRP